MKNNIFAAVFAIAALAPAQIFAQVQEGQTPEQQVQELIKIIKSEISERLPEYEETLDWIISTSEEVMDSQKIHGRRVITLGDNAQYLWFKDNVSRYTEAIIKGMKDEEFNFDLYQIDYLNENDTLKLVIFLDYQNPVTLEDLQKGSLKGTGIKPGDLR
jgi:hypothetical protein